MSPSTLLPADPSSPRVLEITDAHGLNHQPGETFAESLYRAVPEGPSPAVAVDLGSVDLLSSRGVRILVNLKRHIERARGRLVLFRLSPSVRHQLQATRLADHFLTVPDRKAALDLLRPVPSL